MKRYRHNSGIFVLILMIFLVGAGCKSRKKTAELNAAAAEKAKMEAEAKRQQELEAQRAKDAADEKARMDAEAKAREAKSGTPTMKLNQYFDAISNSSNASSANASINEALALFESPDAPVLIIISQEGNNKDYDKPTTIKAYLNYLKDQKKNVNKIDNLEFNSSGKISAVELKK